MDRFFRGVISGMAGGVVMNIWSFIAYYLLDLEIFHFHEMGWFSVV